MQLPRLLTGHKFWLGFALGGLAALLVIVGLASVWVLRAKHAVGQRLDQQWEQYVARTQPLLRPPPLPGEKGQDEMLASLGPRVDLTEWKLSKLDGGAITSGQLRSRPLFLNFWATWCTPCIAELPAVQQLMGSNEAKRLGLDFLLVTDEDEEDVERFLATRQDLQDLPIALAHDGIPAEVWFRARPETVIIDCADRVLLRHTGPADWSSQRFVDFLVREFERTCRG